MKGLRFRVEWSDEARENLRTRADWIALDNPDAAHGFVRAVRKVGDTLIAMPRSGRRVRLRRKASGEVRQYSVPGYRTYQVIYRVDAELVVILAVIHGAMDYRIGS